MFLRFFTLLARSRYFSRYGISDQISNTGGGCLHFNLCWHPWEKCESICSSSSTYVYIVGQADVFSFAKATSLGEEKLYSNSNQGYSTKKMILCQILLVIGAWVSTILYFPSIIRWNSEIYFLTIFFLLVNNNKVMVF